MRRVGRAVCGIGAGVFSYTRFQAGNATKAANGAMGALSYEFSFLSAHDPHLENGIALMFLDTIGSKLCFESRQLERTAECRSFLGRLL